MRMFATHEEIRKRNTQIGIILSELLTPSFTSPSFGDKVMASSRVPRFCSGYCGSFRSRDTSSVLQGDTVCHLHINYHQYNAPHQYQYCKLLCTHITVLCQSFKATQFLFFALNESDFLVIFFLKCSSSISFV